MAKIQHKDLPDQYLHEPKGARTALVGTVYIADGEGAGSFDYLSISSLNFDAEALPQITLTTIPTPLNVSGAGLQETATGVMSDVGYVTQVPVATIKAINKNFKELYNIYTQDVSIHAALKSDVEALASKLNTVITRLESLGFIDNE